MIEDYFGLGLSYSEVSSLLCWKLSLVGAFPLRSVCVPFREETLATQASGGGGGGGKKNRNVAVVVYSFTIYEAVLKKKLSVGPMWDR